MAEHAIVAQPMVRELQHVPLALVGLDEAEFVAHERLAPKRTHAPLGLVRPDDHEATGRLDEAQVRGRVVTAQAAILTDPSESAFPTGAVIDHLGLSAAAQLSVFAPGSAALPIRPRNRFPALGASAKPVRRLALASATAAPHG